MTARRDDLKLAFGLGNQGREYHDTYHNAGLLAVEYLTSGFSKNGFKTDSSKSFKYLKLGNLVCAKSLVFMNESGQAVLKAIKYFKLKHTQVLVIHDDSDIALGKYKISFGSRSAGHKGVESIIKSLGSKNFFRLRIGIRKGRGQASNFVLKKITKSDREALNKVFSEIEILNLEI